MNRKQLADRIGNIDDRLVQQAEDVPNYARLRREKRLKRLAGMAAVLVLMASSPSAGKRSRKSPPSRSRSCCGRLV